MKAARIVCVGKYTCMLKTSCVSVKVSFRHTCKDANLFK